MSRSRRFAGAAGSNRTRPRSRRPRAGAAAASAARERGLRDTAGRHARHRTGEQWRRTFDDRRLDTRQYVAGNGDLAERFGLLEFRFRLAASDGSLIYPSGRRGADVRPGPGADTVGLGADRRRARRPGRGAPHPGARARRASRGRPGADLRWHHRHRGHGPHDRRALAARDSGRHRRVRHRLLPRVAGAAPRRGGSRPPPSSNSTRRGTSSTRCCSPRFPGSRGTERGSLVLIAVFVAEIMLTLTDFVVEIAVRKQLGDVYAGATGHARGHGHPLRRDVSPT